MLLAKDQSKDQSKGPCRAPAGTPENPNSRSIPEYDQYIEGPDKELAIIKLGEVYDVLWEDDTSYYPAIALPFGDFSGIGISGSMRDILQHIPRPGCYQYKGNDITRWSLEYEDGEPLMNQRKYLFAFLDPNKISVPLPGCKFPLPNTVVYQWSTEDHVRWLDAAKELALQNELRHLINQFRTRAREMQQPVTCHVRSRMSPCENAAHDSTSHVVSTTSDDMYGRHSDHETNDYLPRFKAEFAFSQVSTPTPWESTHSEAVDSRVFNIQATSHGYPATPVRSANLFEDSRNEVNRQCSIAYGSDSDGAHTAQWTKQSHIYPTYNQQNGTEFKRLQHPDD
ncbi:hypothetical protein NPX13_g10439 [Xylaria arbuscula]|uniref:Uncharacterized protein n=1 Tax=Xylaria arbuscula TaxID=114810 RepID=A0A9W8N4M8_9PEZI|nr:hypothetical protein NPX13_g10439 [Xylaria arbuscula]